MGRVDVPTGPRFRVPGLWLEFASEFARGHDGTAAARRYRPVGSAHSTTPTLRRGLLATTSLVSLVTGTVLLGVPGFGPTSAAACTINIAGNNGPFTNSTPIDCIIVHAGATVTGNLTNNSTITTAVTPVGIAVGAATINGAIVNNGSITSGTDAIILDSNAVVTGGITNAGTINAGGSGIASTFGSSVAGGIYNSGAISAHVGIAVGDATFSGGITNAGTIAATHDGIAVSLSSFGGGITNSGTITATNFNGIQVNDTSTFSRGITNSGQVVANKTGIFLTSVQTFSGGISNSGNLSGNLAGIALSPVQNFLGGITNTGTITGRSGIFISNSTQGINLFNSGTITGTNGAAVLFGAGPNTLTLGPGFEINGAVVGAGSDTLQLGGSGNGTFDLGTIGGFPLQYVGFTTFNEVGSGTWTVTGTFGQSSPWTVQSGTLLVSGDLSSASSLTVMGGTPAGAGTVGNTHINSGGAFAPGTPGSPGTSMTVSGNLAFQSGAIYLVQLNPTSATSANVTGTASLAGTVDAVFAPGSYVKKQYDDFGIRAA